MRRWTASSDVKEGLGSHFLGRREGAAAGHFYEGGLLEGGGGPGRTSRIYHLAVKAAGGGWLAAATAVTLHDADATELSGGGGMSGGPGRGWSGSLSFPLCCTRFAAQCRCAGVKYGI